MDISPTEAEEALAAIQTMMQKTRRSISSSGAYKFLILWGVIWMLGFLGSQFLPKEIASYVWIGLDILGGILSMVIGVRLNRGVRSSAPTTSGKRIGFFWLLLFFYCVAAIGIAWPVDGKQFAMFIILFVTVGWIAMGLLLSFASVWWGLALLGLSLVSYFLLEDYFYLIMAFVGGGGMIALGIYVRNRW
ncbi:MAG: hypothetical protein A2Z71_00530 [Chloroflexi bacterium RBG_13_50_21]|nr:MAG: hypothetical protein A2Z71_00530 [Chloroflexi bacterium RBG_13_50_21]